MNKKAILKQQQLHLEKAFNLVEVRSKGGAWFIPLAKVADVYEKLGPDECAGLEQLNMDVELEDVGEYFSDLLIVNDEVVHVDLCFTLFNN